MPVHSNSSNSGLKWVHPESLSRTIPNRYPSPQPPAPQPQQPTAPLNLVIPSVASGSSAMNPQLPPSVAGMAAQQVANATFPAAPVQPLLSLRDMRQQPGSGGLFGLRPQAWSSR